MYVHDYDWSGGILLDFKKIVDKCKERNGVQPAPTFVSIPGIAFNKATPYNYHAGTSITLCGSLTNPSDCRWNDCQLPSSISASQTYVQMTMTIFVR